MNWAVHFAVNLGFAVAIAAWQARGTPTRAHVWPILWPMLASNLIDVDHLLADPIYDPTRCSLGFHPLHTWYAAVAYSVAVFWRRLRWFATGALTHLVLDGVDCAW